MHVMPKNQLELVPERFRIPDALWERIEPLLPPEKAKPKGGRPREDDRKMLTGIFYVLRTGIQWKALPRCLGAASTVHDRYQEWERAGVFQSLWADALKVYDEEVGLEWEWQSMDGAMTKAPLGGGKRARTPPTGASRARNAASSRRGRVSPSVWRWKVRTATTTR